MIPGTRATRALCMRQLCLKPIPRRVAVAVLCGLVLLVCLTGVPAADWRIVMDRLDRHYGGDASLDAAAAREIGRFLEAHAGRRPGGSDGALPRITTGRWFAKEHRDVAPATFDSPGVKSRANCAACHRNAAQGDFDEHDIHIPR